MDQSHKLFSSNQRIDAPFNPTPYDHNSENIVQARPTKVASGESILLANPIPATAARSNEFSNKSMNHCTDTHHLKNGSHQVNKIVRHPENNGYNNINRTEKPVLQSITVNRTGISLNAPSKEPFDKQLNDQYEKSAFNVLPRHLGTNAVSSTSSVSTLLNLHPLEKVTIQLGNDSLDLNRIEESSRKTFASLITESPERVQFIMKTTSQGFNPNTVANHASKVVSERTDVNFFLAENYFRWMETADVQGRSYQNFYREDVTETEIYAIRKDEQSTVIEDTFPIGKYSSGEKFEALPVPIQLLLCGLQHSREGNQDGVIVTQFSLGLLLENSSRLDNGQLHKNVIETGELLQKSAMNMLEKQHGNLSISERPLQAKSIKLVEHLRPD